MICRSALILVLALLQLGCLKRSDADLSDSNEATWPNRVIGYYAVPIDAFPRVAAAGFNVVHNYRFESHWEPQSGPFVDAAREYLDAAQQHELQVMLGLPRNWLRQGHAAAIRQSIQQLREHPAILAWYEDEIGQDGDVQAVQLLARIVQEEDPTRGLIIEEGTDLPELRALGRLRMFTYYPVSHQARQRGRLRTVQERFPVNKLNIPFMPALQTFGRDLIKGYSKQNLVAPRWPELQFTLYSSLMAGASGYFIYTYLHSTRYDEARKKAGKWPYVEAGELPEVAPAMWESAQRCVVESKVLFELLADAQPAAGVRLAKDVRGVDVASWETPQGRVVLLSNATYEARSVALVGLSKYRTVQRLHHDLWSTSVTLEDATFKLTVPGPGGVCLLMQ